VLDRLHLPSLDGGVGWLNTEPLDPTALRGKVVLVNFWTLTCINWLRQEPYVRAWSQKYRDHGLVVVGAHSPEFPFEHDVEKVRPALEAMAVDYPIAMDNNFAVWGAFENNAWPALYFIDAEGRIRHHHLGEEDYERSERVIQELLAEAGFDGIDRELVSPEISAVEAPADWETLGSPESYVGYERAARFASPDRLLPDQPHDYGDPGGLELNEWALSGKWTAGRQATVMNEAGGRITYRFHARDVNLVLGPSESGDQVRFRVHVDGTPPGEAHGSDVDDQGNGTVDEFRLYQLVRQPGAVSDRTFEVTFLDPGARAYVFTFG